MTLVRLAPIWLDFELTKKKKKKKKKKKNFFWNVFLSDLADSLDPIYSIISFCQLRELRMCRKIVN